MIILRRTWLMALALSLAFAFSLSNGLGSVAYGSEIVSHDLESPSIAKNMMGISSLRHIEVYLPDGYEEGNQRYPVLYWIPGYKGNAGASFYRNALDDAIQSGKIPPTIAVFIDVHEGTYFLNSPVFGNWEDFIISEVIPFIDKTYRTIPDMQARGLMGHSVGGYSALMLPIRHPGIWGGIGANDASIWAMWYVLHDEADFPELLKPHFFVVRWVIQNLPKDFEEYASVDWKIQALIQLGTAFSPNPSKPLFCDFPISSEGEWVPEVREKWSAYDLTNPQTLIEHGETLNSLLSITLVVPETVNIDENNRVSNIHLIERLQEAGVYVTRLDMPGGHIDFGQERFIALAEQLLGAMLRVTTSVSSRGKIAALWGKIKNSNL